MQSIAEPSSALLAAIMVHAEQENPRECCGVVIEQDRAMRYIPCRNTSENGADTFVLHPADYAAAEDLGEIKLIVHSHPFASPAPSDLDRIVCARGDIPWLIVNFPVGNYYLLQPEPYSPPLVGRAFYHGVTDCYTLIRDYYQQTLATPLPEFKRDDNWWNKGDNLYLDNFGKADFVRVEGEPREHDVILMQLRSPVPNHAGIYLGGEIMLHHMHGRLSTRDVYGGYWAKITVAILRHRNFINADH